MPKTALSTSEILKQVTTDRSYDNCWEVVETTKLRCKPCNYILPCKESRYNERAKSHCSSQKHKLNLMKPIQPSVSAVFKKQCSTSKAIDDLMGAFVAADIPLSKLEHPVLNKVLSEKFGKLPGKTFIRDKIVPELFEAKMSAARLLFEDTPVVLMLDETRDDTGRNVLNILCGRLDGEPLKMHLIKVDFIDRTDSTHVSQSFVSAVSDMKIRYDDVWLVVTDQAKYMIKCFRDLKVLFPKMHHVSCLAHAMHRVCEKIRDDNPLVDSFLGKMRVVFTRSRDRSQLWQDVTGLPLPPKPCLTRWGTWINAAVFYINNFNKVEQFIEELPESNSKISGIKKIIGTDEFRSQMYSVFCMRNLPTFITKLEKHGLEMEEQVKILNEFKAQVESTYLEKLQNCLRKNPDFALVMDNNAIEFRCKMRYAPLVSVDVERSFSMFKAFFRSNRHRFIETNIEKHLVIICNPDL